MRTCGRRRPQPAAQLFADEIVALKRLKMEKEKEGFPITSLREINTILKAQHPNIVTVRVRPPGPVPQGQPGGRAHPCCAKTEASRPGHISPLKVTTPDPNRSLPSACV